MPHISVITQPLVGRFESKRLLLGPADVAALGVLHLEDLELAVRLDTGQILGRNKDELAVFHLLGDVDHRLKSDLTGDGVEEDVKLVHHAEGRLEILSKGKEESQRSKAPFAATVVTERWSKERID